MKKGKKGNKPPQKKHSKLIVFGVLSIEKMSIKGTDKHPVNKQNAKKVDERTIVRGGKVAQ